MYRIYAATAASFVGPKLTGEGFCRIRGHTALTLDEEVSAGSDAVLGTDSVGFADNLMRRSTMERFVKRVPWRAWALRWIDLYGGWLAARRAEYSASIDVWGWAINAVQMSNAFNSTQVIQGSTEMEMLKDLRPIVVPIR